MSMDNDHEAHQALHQAISNAEQAARELRLLSMGQLTLAVVRNLETIPDRRQGLPWHEAHEAADTIYA